MLPDRAVPSASLIEISPSSANASSAVTTRPGFQTKPEARDRCECTETIDGVARATTLATAEESEERTAALGSVMAKTPVGADPNLGSAEALRNYPDGQEHALQANFPCPRPNGLSPKTFSLLARMDSFLDMRLRCSGTPCQSVSEGYRNDRFCR